MQDKTVLTPKEVAGILRVHYMTVLEWIEEGKLVAWKTPGGQWRINRSDLPDETPKNAQG